MSQVTSDPNKTAVLFVEAMNGMLGPDSVMKTIRNAAEPKIPAMAKLAHGARASGATVCHLTFFPVAHGRSLNHRPPLFKRLGDAMAGWHKDHPAVQPIPEIGIDDADLVLPRNTGLSPTYGTETYNLLRNIGIETVVLAGISVNIAIPVAAIEATDEDFDVIIPSDAVAGSPPDHVQSMLDNTLAFVATITTVDELVAGWANFGPS